MIEINTQCGFRREQLRVGEERTCATGPGAVEVPACVLAGEGVSPVEVVTGGGGRCSDGDPAAAWIGSGGVLSGDGNEDGIAGAIFDGVTEGGGAEADPIDGGGAKCRQGLGYTTQATISCIRIGP